MGEQPEKQEEVRILPVCPTCEEALTDIWGADKYHITWQDGRWVKEEDPSRLVCGKCYNELDHDDVEDIEGGRAPVRR